MAVSGSSSLASMLKVDCLTFLLDEYKTSKMCPCGHFCLIEAGCIEKILRLYETCPGADTPTCEVAVIGHTKTSLIRWDDDKQIFTVQVRTPSKRSSKMYFLHCVGKKSVFWRMFSPGTVLKYNTLWRAGMHYHYVFFRVTHITKRGTIMGRYVQSKEINEEWTHDYSTSRWTVETGPSKSRIRRLPHPKTWHPLTPDELSDGIRATSCVY